jgi:hypothetical protein
VRVVCIAVVPIGPQLRSRARVKQLGRYAHPIAETPDATFDDGADVELGAHIARAKPSSLEGEATGAAGDPYDTSARQRPDNFVGDTVAEILCVGLIRHVDERHDRDGRTLGVSPYGSSHQLGRDVCALLQHLQHGRRIRGTVSGILGEALCDERSQMFETGAGKVEHRRHFGEVCDDQLMGRLMPGKRMAS